MSGQTKREAVVETEVDMEEWTERPSGVRLRQVTPADEERGAEIFVFTSVLHRRQKKA